MTTTKLIQDVHGASMTMQFHTIQFQKMLLKHYSWVIKLRCEAQLSYKIKQNSYFQIVAIRNT